MPPAPQFAGTQIQIIAQLVFPRDPRQGVPLHQARAQAAELPFAGTGKLVIEGVGNHKAQDGIAQIFQAFVV